MIFETHAHYDDDAFDADRDSLLQGIHRGTHVSGEGETDASQAVPVSRIINCGASLRTSRNSLELARKYDFIYAAVGVHPDDSGELVSENDISEYVLSEEQLEKYRGIEKRDIGYLRELASDEKVVAIGEIGLDYHWDVWPRQLQKDIFIRQWELAIELGLPIEIHSRDAAEDTFDIVRTMYEREKAAGRNLRADMHCYSYSVDQAREYAKMGLYFGVGGVVTFKNARKTHELVREIPLERILLETDAPYLAPEPFRGQRNNSGYIERVAEKIAELRGIDVEEVYKVTYGNARTFFEI